MSGEGRGGSLAGQTALVTGGTAGIGRAIAERFARDGATVFVTGRDEVRGAALTADSAAAGLAITWLRADMAEPADCRAVVERAASHAGRLDVVVNNAAILIVASVEETSDEDWDRVLRTNLSSIFWVSRAAIPHLRASGGGSIVNIASVHANATVARLAAYATAKGAVISLSRQMAHDLVVDRIRVNAVVVGGVDTAMSAGHAKALGRPPGDGTEVDALAMGRTGRPSEIAGAIRFLVGEDASFVNGSAFVVDGGMLARLALD